jgi:hypothetical protein
MSFYLKNSFKSYSLGTIWDSAYRIYRAEQRALISVPNHARIPTQTEEYLYSLEWELIKWYFFVLLLTSLNKEITYY